MSAATRFDASIIIPTYNRAALLSDALQSVQALAIPPDWRVELLVIDNNSTDNTEEIVAKFIGAGTPIFCRRVHEPQQGLSHARNRGLAEAASDWAIFLDDDMLVDPQWLVGFRETLDHFSPDLVTGPVEPKFEGPIPAWCDQALLNSVNSSYSLRGAFTRELIAGERHEIPGCNFAVRKKLALMVGGFNTSFGRSKDGMLASEDWEFAMRVEKEGGAAFYAPSCRIRHHISSTKLSKAGLLARWRGLGASEKNIRELHSLPRQAMPLRLRLRSIRLHARWLQLELLRDPQAFRWRLEAERLLRSI